ncbi:MAG: helix-turn-helix domain-containing protein [Zoogloeaceae bacterium]|jgi:SOS-response transcriptional repressor LexA|nr:helix-turn-helix domain-containing protein [Zoogloeaceae bacterium]
MVAHPASSRFAALRAGAGCACHVLIAQYNERAVHLERTVRASVANAPDGWLRDASVPCDGAVRHAVPVQVFENVDRHIHASILYVNESICQYANGKYFASAYSQENNQVMMDKAQRIGDALDVAMKGMNNGKGMTQAELSRASGVPQPTISRTLKGESIPETKTLSRLVDVLGIEKFGKALASVLPGDMYAHALSPIAVWEHEDELPPGDFVKVPRLDVRLSAGHGRAVAEVDLVKDRPQVFRAEWIRALGVKPGKLASMYADGDSMEPRIADGDSLLVDTSQTTVIDGKVFALVYADEVRVKRLYKRVDGGLMIVSDNERNYPKLEVPAEQMEHVKIIGRVIHVQGTGGL